MNLTTLNQLKDYEIDENGKGECGSNLCFNINNGIAIMTIRSFNYYGQNLHTCKQFLDNCFDEINSKGINNLILDFRDNAGGDPYCASYLLQYIAEKSFQYYKTGTSGYLDLQELIEPHPNRFKGKPFVLINGRCASTTGQLSALIKENNIGIFVGQETGATYRCNAATRTFTLENSKTTVYVATRTFESNVESLPKDRGIIPDYEIEPSISDILNGEDSALKFTQVLIQNK